MRSQRSNIQFAKYHIWKHKELVRKWFTHVTTRKKIFAFTVNHLNSDLNAVNYSQKLEKFIKSIQVKFSGPSNDDEAENLTKFNYI